MKQLILTILLAFTLTATFSQSLKYKQTNIEITNDGGFSTISNDIRFTITSDLSEADTLQKLFPEYSFKLSGGILTYASTVAVPTMWDMISIFKIEQSDVDKTVKDAIEIWSINIMYQENLLNLNLADWSISD